MNWGFLEAIWFFCTLLCILEFSSLIYNFLLFLFFLFCSVLFLRVPLCSL